MNLQTTTLVNRFSALLGCALWFAASPAFGQAFPVHNVSPLGGQSTFPAMAVGPAGDAVVAWYADAGASVALRVGRYHPPTDTWSPPVDLVSFPRRMPSIATE